jgi:sigma-B regulation protein RsbU (phosphoserine phosphatase)
MTCTLLRAYPRPPVHPDEVLKYLNENLCKVVGNSFITAVYGVYNTVSRVLRVTTAGHSAPLLYRPHDGKTIEIPCEGTFVMGFQPYDDVPVTELKLQAGDRVLFFTDGPTERFNPEKEMYGVERLGRQLSKDVGKDPKGILDAIVGDVEAFAGGLPCSDDQTLVLLIIE